MTHAHTAPSTRRRDMCGAYCSRRSRSMTAAGGAPAAATRLSDGTHDVRAGCASAADDGGDVTRQPNALEWTRTTTGREAHKALNLARLPNSATSAEARV